MRLAELLDRCLALEERTAAVYRKFAAARHDDPELAQLWVALAADEDEHARSIRDVLRDLGTGEGELTAVEGCEEQIVADVAARLREAETLDANAPSNRHLAAALDIELSEIEALRRLGLRASSGTRCRTRIRPRPPARGYGPPPLARQPRAAGGRVAPGTRAPRYHRRRVGQLAETLATVRPLLAPDPTLRPRRRQAACGGRRW